MPNFTGHLKGLARHTWDLYAKGWSRLTGRHYLEDFVRVYPDGLVFNRLGIRKPAERFHLNNFLNHKKFYEFVAQFVRGCRVVDVGCGSGYGSAILREAGASYVEGVDLSKHAIDFARRQYGQAAQFSVQDAVDMHSLSDNFCDVIVCSEVLEHVKEYGKEEAALREMRRILRPDGLLVVGTPNSELLGDHGFEFSELDELFGNVFTRYCIIENALVPEGPGQDVWEKRLQDGRHGVIVDQNINIAEVAVCGSREPEVKPGTCSGVLHLVSTEVDTSHLHNTHSWVVIARCDK